MPSIANNMSPDNLLAAFAVTAQIFEQDVQINMKLVKDAIFQN